jgi:hypothetical protein
MNLSQNRKTPRTPGLARLYTSVDGHDQDHTILSVASPNPASASPTANTTRRRKGGKVGSSRVTESVPIERGTDDENARIAAASLSVSVSNSTEINDNHISQLGSDSESSGSSNNRVRSRRVKDRNRRRVRKGNKRTAKTTKETNSILATPRSPWVFIMATVLILLVVSGFVSWALELTTDSVLHDTLLVGQDDIVSDLHPWIIDLTKRPFYILSNITKPRVSTSSNTSNTSSSSSTASSSSSASSPLCPQWQNQDNFAWTDEEISKTKCEDLTASFHSIELTENFHIELCISSTACRHGYVLIERKGDYCQKAMNITVSEDVDINDYLKKMLGPVKRFPNFPSIT